ncbi:hypothetical protein MUN82_08850 [Hymenobacter aerilatus]|uniref:Uncharacterized protein n=1 Tax=Hymenobacter aerilatus TaxID=2932251 RepID=A0A8T9T0M5_9BACT|nr:hypothetical protein [Hymenobacter aerilatus]UOR07191.1 hypothetical protein MUN82_08850 [Hymenobacter aerilatus]
METEVTPHAYPSETAEQLAAQLVGGPIGPDELEVILRHIEENQPYNQRLTRQLALNVKYHMAEQRRRGQVHRQAQSELVAERDRLSQELEEAKQRGHAARSIATKAITCCMAAAAIAQKIKNILLEKEAGVVAYQGALDAIIQGLEEYTPVATPQKENQP